MIQKNIQPLVAGERLTWKEFERRWDATPGLRRAELVGGVVYMAPLGLDHGESDIDIGGLFLIYITHTPGCSAGSNATWRMFGQAPQPDAHLRILEAYGGRAGREGKYGAGGPELLAEVCDSSGPIEGKKRLYYRAGVREYVTVLLRERIVRWYVWRKGGYGTMRADRRGIFRSRVFPGLWLNAPALFANRRRELVKTLELGLATPEHDAFVEKLEKTAARRKQK